MGRKVVTHNSKNDLPLDNSFGIFQVSGYEHSSSLLPKLFKKGCTYLCTLWPFFKTKKIYKKKSCSWFLIDWWMIVVSGNIFEKMCQKRFRIPCSAQLDTTKNYKGQDCKVVSVLSFNWIFRKILEVLKKLLMISKRPLSSKLYKS